MSIAERFKEMTYINLSLFHLATCINSLASKKGGEQRWHEFRNSKLTMLLAHSLQGNSKSALVATLSPSDTFYDDSLQTLRFTQAMKVVKTKPTVNSKTA